MVNFYMTPGYFTWDPSKLVLVSFAVFFAMIIADADYAALMALALLLFWRKMVVWLGLEMDVRAVTVIGGLAMIVGALGVGVSSHHRCHHCRDQQPCRPAEYK